MRVESRYCFLGEVGNMNCCINCFNDQNIFDYINSDDYILGDCDFCNSKDTEIYDLSKLCEHFKFKISSLFDLYDSIYVTHFEFSTFEPDNIFDKYELLTIIQNDWNLFNMDDLSEEKAYDLLN